MRGIKFTEYDCVKVKGEEPRLPTLRDSPDEVAVLQALARRHSVHSLSSVFVS